MNGNFKIYDLKKKRRETKMYQKPHRIALIVNVDVHGNKMSQILWPNECLSLFRSMHVVTILYFD